MDIITKKTAKRFQKWLKEKCKKDVVSSAAETIISENTIICDYGFYELPAYQTKSGNVEIFKF